MEEDPSWMMAMTLLLLGWLRCVALRCVACVRACVNATAAAAAGGGLLVMI
jgi:hypothetical protein